MDELEDVKRRVKIPIRFIIGGMICLAGIVISIVRGNMSFIILAMTKPIYNTTVDVPDYGPRYEWSAFEQGLVIGSYFWGMVLIISFSGILCERYGPRKIAGCSMMIASILSALTPVAANYLWLTIAIRFFTGLSAGTITPSLQALISKWAPPEEKGKFVSILLSNGIGIVIDWSMSSVVIKNLGWEFSFYIYFVILGLFSMAWFFIVYDSPAMHPNITTAEKAFILCKLNTKTIKKKPWPPLKSILLSKCVWSLAILHFGNMYATNVVLTAAPKYLSEVHRFDISATAFLASVPHLVRVPFAIFFGFVGDFLFKRKVMSATSIRKSFTLCSHFIPACFLIGITIVGDRPFTCVAFISLAMGFCGAISITSLQNAHDLSPNFATTIFGFAHTVGSTSGFIAPLVVAHFTKEKSTQDEWQYIFFITAGIYVGSEIIFILFGSGCVQKWNEIEEEVNDIKEQKVFIEYSK